MWEPFVAAVAMLYSSSSALATLVSFAMLVDRRLAIFFPSANKVHISTKYKQDSNVENGKPAYFACNFNK